MVLPSSGHKKMVTAGFSKTLVPVYHITWYYLRSYIYGVTSQKTILLMVLVHVVVKSMLGILQHM
jgi:hypothetical protein